MVFFQAAFCSLFSWSRKPGGSIWVGKALQENTFKKDMKMCEFNICKELSPITFMHVSATSKFKFPVRIFIFANSVTNLVRSTWQMPKHYLLKDIQNISTSYFRSIVMLLLSQRAPSVYLFKLSPLFSFNLSWNSSSEILVSIFTNNSHILVCNVRKTG